MAQNKLIVFFAVLLVTLGIFHIFVPPKSQLPIPPVQQQPPQMPAPPEPQIPKAPTISNPIPSYLPYDKLVTQLRKWNEEAPDLTELSTIGRSSKDQQIAYFRVTNRFTTNKPEVLITACIHGNEPHSTSTVMAYIGTMLASYGKDTQITKLIDERDIYFVPVLSPDSYPNSRSVDGVDPNRDFNNKRSAPVRAIQNFVEKHKFKAVLSGHTWGRVYLIPWGESMEKCPDHEAYAKLVGKMGRMSNYRVMRACEMYQSGGRINNPPIRYGEPSWSPYNATAIPTHGGELDWHYKRGAFSIVMEFGTHQRIPINSEIKEEFDRTFKSVLLFIEQAPITEMHPPNRNSLYFLPITQY